MSTAGNGGDRWQDHWYEWPRQTEDILGHAREAASTYNVYFSSHLFGEKNPNKAAVLPTRTIQADLDGADIFSLSVPATALVRTSEGRHQAFWVLRDTAEQGLIIPNDILEEFSRRLTYSIQDCDRTGWPLGKRLRFPNTINHKYLAPQAVEIISIANRKVDPSTLDILPEVPDKFTLAIEGWVDLPHEASVLEDVPPLETILALQKAGKITSGAKTQYSNPSKDRSTALWRLMNELFTAGLNRELVYWLSFNSRNNKFRDRRYGGTRDLRKDVLRAENNHSTGSNIREDIEKVNRNPSLTRGDRYELVARLVRTYMQSQGQFINANDGSSYYLRSDIGRPIILSLHTKMLRAFMTMEMGINSSTELYRYVVEHVKSYADSLNTEAEVATLSFFDLENMTLYLHTGRKDIIVLTRNSRFTTPNGSGELLFKWSKMIEPFGISESPLPNDAKWYEFLFDAAVDNVTNVTPEQARALMAVWTMYVLFRSDLTRPVLSLFGQPGSGKSTLMRKLYRLFYGRTKDLNFLSTDKDFIHATTENPMVCFDNADTWQRWLPDLLATSISNSTMETRQLFTDRETIEHRRQAMVALTSHSPKFIREDVADRLLVLVLARREHYVDEKQILSQVTQFRSQIMGAILRDAQRILNTPMPTQGEAPQFRLQDFATFGLWIARGLDLGDDFISAISALRHSQSNLVIEGDEILVTAVERTLLARRKAKRTPEFMSVGEWHTKLSEFSEDKLSFLKIFKSPAKLGSKLWTVMEALKINYHIEFKLDTRTGARLWFIDFKESDTDKDAES